MYVCINITYYIHMSNVHTHININTYIYTHTYICSLCDSYIYIYRPFTVL